MKLEKKSESDEISHSGWDARTEIPYFYSETSSIKFFILNVFFSTVPVSPVGVQQGMTYNTTAAGIWLDMWNDGGCSILYFIVEYRKDTENEWKVSSKPVSPSDRIYVIYDLTPATRYQLRITAHNNIGSTVQVYNFTTLNEEGGMLIVLYVFVAEFRKHIKMFPFPFLFLM